MKCLTLESVMAEYSKKIAPTGARVKMMEQYRDHDAGYGVMIEWKQGRSWFGSLRKMEFFSEYADGEQRALELVTVLRENYPDLDAHASICADRPEWKGANRRNKAAMTRLCN